MQRWKNVGFNISLALNCLLLFLLFFESKLSVPTWLQVAGRMHPLVLHFPIVLIIIYATVIIALSFKKTERNISLKNELDIILLFASITAVTTALAGLFLSREDGYDPEALWWHKWSAVLISLFTLGWFYFRRGLNQTLLGTIATAAIALIIVTFTGHQGAGITHGQNFLFAPITPEEKKELVSLEQAKVYADMVRPILEEKCMFCHNSKKAKGELVMETEILLLKGGKTGVLWDSTAKDLGLLLHRLHLPLDEKKHMPPQGKTQLTADETDIIARWIEKGADFQLKVIDLPATDTLRQLADAIFVSKETAVYDFDKADAATINALNTVNRVVSEESINSPALSVNFFNSQLYQPAQLKELDKIKKQIVSLDLAKMPVKDVDLKEIGAFENLRNLNLGFTDITGATLGDLKNLKFLKTLSLSGTTVTADQLKALENLPELKSVYLWKVPIASETIKDLQEKYKSIHWEMGFHDDSTLLKLTLPVVKNKNVLFAKQTKLELAHYIRGAVIRYTLDGTDPDSLNSPVFDDKSIDLTADTKVKAKAFKPGWISSDTLNIDFYKTSIRPDTVIFLKPSDPKYRADSTNSLIDLARGEFNTATGNWFGFLENDLECLLPFKNPVPISSISLSAMVNSGAAIFPPTMIEVWGGDEENKLHLIARISPPQLTKMLPAPYLTVYKCEFKPVTLKYIKVIGKHIAKLPSWHYNKNKNGWLFVDEILIN